MSPPLSPDADRFTLMALLKRGQHSRVSLLKGTDTKVRAGRLLQQPGGATEAQLLEGLDREARQLRGLQLPHVVTFDQLVEGQGGTWMLFEYVPGTLLGQYQGREDTLAVAWVSHWLGCLLQALNALHTHTPPLVLGHLEPFDVVVNQQDLTIVDLGLFERIFPELSARGLGTHPFKAFIAPERRSAVHPAATADLFSVGALAFWLLTARAPVVKRPASREGLALALRERRPSVPEELEHLILDLLSFYPSARPASAAEALERWTRLELARPDGPLPEAESIEIAFAANTTRRDKQGIEPPPRRVPPSMPRGGLIANPQPARSAVAEFLEDVLWAARQRPLFVIFALVLLLAPLAAWHRAPVPTSTLPPVILTVTSGSAATDSGAAGHHWRYTAAARVGETLLAPSAPVQAVGGGSHLWLGPGACVVAQGQDAACLKLGWVAGEIHVTTPTDGQADVSFEVRHLQVPPDSEVWITASSIACHRGKVRWLDADLVAPQEVKR